MENFNLVNTKTLNLKELQSKVVAWRQYNFPNANSDSQLKGVMEELGELVHADLKESQGIRQQDYYSAKVDSVGDMIIFLLNYCEMNNIDFEVAVRTAWNEACTRDWITYPKNGRTE